ncbi:MAG: type I glutamate--ammonia ligase [Candidatus Nitrosopolaris sp.]
MSFSRSNSVLQPEEKEQGIDSIKMIIDAGFIQLRYTDVLGKFLAKYVFGNKESFDSFFKSGIGVDGSSVKGFASIDESDMLLIPDRSTVRIFPPSLLSATASSVSSNYNNKILTVIADVYQGFNEGRLVRDPRYVSQRMEEYLIKNNLSCQMGPEVECFVFDNIIFNHKNNNNNLNADRDNDNSEYHEPKIISLEQYGADGCKYPIKRKGGYDAPPFQDSLLEFRFDVAEILRKHFSINVTNLNHEVASCGQIEINFMHSTLTKAADSVQIYKDVVRNVARKYNKVANFMPKPLFDKNDPLDGGDNGSGMHTSISLWNDSSANVFYDGDDYHAELSQIGRYFIGGLIEHAHSLAAIVAPTINSYHRLIPGFEAPVYIAWAKGNRSAIIRIPINERNNAKSKRIEFRAPDPAANPYLAFSAIVAAGLDGIQKTIDPGSPTDENIYKMSDSKRNSLGIKSLPGSLGESLEALKSDSDYLKKCFPDELLETYIMLKYEEVAIVGGKSIAQELIFYYDI